MDLKDFNRLYERYYKRSFLFTKSYVHDDMVAEDIAAECLFKYWKMLSHEAITSSDSLLITMLKNKSLDYLRQEATHLAAMENLMEYAERELQMRISSLEACDPEELFSAELQNLLHKALMQLPEQTCRIFKLSRLENKSVKEIAEQTGLTVKGVEYHITKALKFLRVALKDYLPFVGWLWLW